MLAKVLVSTEGMSYSDWLDYRRRGIGGSDASVICGINRYKSPVELWMEKTNQLQVQESGEAAYWGTQLEPFVRDEFTKRTGIEVSKPSVILQSTEHSFMLANLDGICEVQNVGKCIFEAKTASAYKAGEWEDTIPDEYILKDTLQSADTQESFDAILVKIGKIDSEIDKDALTEEQNNVYEALTKDHTELIGSKMRQLEYKKNIDYNKKAAEAFASAFERFRKDEGKYKKQTQLFTLASKTLFAYDASRLFNETLIYYNHVYSYIFSKLDDDGKFALTRYSIECERKLR